MSLQPRLISSIKHDHVAIMRADWGLTQKIITGEKTIETRWYKTKAIPWDRIYPGELVYFKDSGMPVTVVGIVSRVEQFSDLTETDVIDLLTKLAKPDGLGIDSGSIKKFFHLFKDKKYCIAIYLKDIKKIEPFEINKQGFGMQAAWLMVETIEKVKTPIAK